MTGPCATSNWNGEDELFHITKVHPGSLYFPMLLMKSPHASAVSDVRMYALPG